jgi:hypothetical protein
MKLLRSFEEFIFEAVTWLIFYPVTLWRIVTRPLTTMAYSDAEQSDADENRYDEALSPPLLLLVTVVAVNAIAGALHPNTPPTGTTVAKALFASPQNLTLFRALIFSLVPLVAAATLLKRTKVALSRETIRPPFYAQCFLATPCCIVIGLGHAIFQRPDIPNAIGATLLIAGAAWFFVTQIRWFRARLAVSWGNAALTALWAFVQAIAYLILVFIPVAFI